MKNVLMIVALVMTAACASPHKARELDTTVELQSQVTRDSVVGVKNGNMIYQKKVVMGEELRKLQLEVYYLEARVYGGERYNDNKGLYGALRDCRVELGEVNNGGDAKIRWTEAREYVTPDDDYDDVGIDKKQLVGVSQEYLKDRIVRFRTYKKVLLGREDEYEVKIKQCELELGAQKVASRK